MMKFARLFEREDCQVLAFTEYDDEADTTKLRVITKLENGVHVEKAFGFKGDDQTKNANKTLNNFTEEDAFSFHDKFRKINES